MLGYFVFDIRSATRAWQNHFFLEYNCEYDSLKDSSPLISFDGLQRVLQNRILVINEMVQGLLIL